MRERRLPECSRHRPGDRLGGADRGAGEGFRVQVQGFPFPANGRARGMEQEQGLVKIVSATDDAEILGVQIVDPWAGS